MNEFDKHIRDKINDHASPVAPDLWSRMEEKRAVNDLEKGLLGGNSKFWTILLVTFLSVSSVAGYFILNNNSFEPKEILENPIHNSEDVEIALNTTSEIKDNEERSTNNSTSIDNINDQLIVSNNNNDFANLSLEKINGQKIEIYQNNQFQRKEKEIKILEEIIELTPNFSGKQVKIQKEFSSQQITHNNFPKVVEENFNTIVNSLSVLPAWPHFDILSKSITSAKSKDDIQCGDYPRNYPFTYYLDFGFAPQRTVKYFSYNNEAFKTYAQQREQTEGFLFAFAISARLSVVHYTGITFKTGLQYQQTNDFFEFKDNNYTEVVDTGIVTGLLDVAQYNRFKSFDVPIMIGYELDVNNFTFALNTGVHANVSFSKHGYILSPNSAVIRMQNDNSIYKNWVGISLAANFGAYFHLNNKMQLMMEPHFKYSLTSLTSKDYPLEQRNFSTGMRLGLRIRM